MHKTAARDRGVLRRLLAAGRALCRPASRSSSRRRSPRSRAASRVCATRRVRLGAQNDALGARRRVHRRDQRADVARVRRALRHPRPLRAARVSATRPTHGQPQGHVPRSSKGSRRSSPSARRATNAKPGATDERVVAQTLAALRGRLDATTLRASCSPTNRSGRSAPAKTATRRGRTRDGRRFAALSPGSTTRRFSTAAA